MFCETRFRRSIRGALLGLLLLAPQAVPFVPPQQGGPTSLDGLLTALSGRVDDLEAMTFPSKAEKKERKQLARAHAFLELYQGLNDPPDLAALGKLTRAVVRSRSGDATVAGQLDAVLDTLDGVAGIARSDVLAQLPQLRTLPKPKPALLAQKSLDKGDAKRADAHLLWPDDKPRSVKVMLTAIATYQVRSKKAHKALLKGSDNDQRVTSLEVLTDDAQIGHDLELSLQIEVLRDSPQLAVTLSAVRREDVDQDSEQPLQYVLGELVEEDVAAGTHERAVTVVIPPELLPDDYYIVANVDPHGLIYESDEENNFHLDVADMRTFSDTYVDTPNLVLEAFSFDPSIIAVVVSDLDDEVLGASVRVSVSGRQPLYNVPLGFGVSLQDDQLCVPVPGGTECVTLPEMLPVPIWNPLSGTYEDFYVIPEIIPGEPLDVQLDFRWSWDDAAQQVPELLPLLEKMSEGSASNSVLDLVVATVDPTDLIAEYEPHGDDNSGVTTGILQLYKLADCDMEKAYKKKWASDIVGVGIELVGGLDLSAEGAEASVTGALPIWLFSSTPFELFDFQCLATRDPVTHYSAFELDVDFAGFTVYARAFDSDMLDLPEGFTWNEDGFSFESEGAGGTARWFVEKEWPDDEKKRTKTFFVAGFPVLVESKLVGQVGFEAVVTNTDTLSFGVGPYASLGIDLNAKSCLGPFCLGAGGEIVLIEDEFLTTAGTTMTVVTDIDSQGAEATSIAGSLDFDVTNTIKALHGRLYVFAEYPWCDLCWKLFIPYPCHCGQRHSELTIVSWEAFVWSQPLIVKSCETCIPVSGLPVCP